MNPIAAVLRKYRKVSMFAMLILLPLSGGLWAITQSRALMTLSILLSCLSVVAVFTEETVSAAIDDEVGRLQTEVANQREKISSLEEGLRESDRIRMMLEEQNSRVSAELIAKAAHSEAA